MSWYSQKSSFVLTHGLGTKPSFYSPSGSNQPSFRHFLTLALMFVVLGSCRFIFLLLSIHWFGQKTYAVARIPSRIITLITWTSHARMRRNLNHRWSTDVAKNEWLNNSGPSWLISPLCNALWHRYYRQFCHSLSWFTYLVWDYGSSRPVISPLMDSRGGMIISFFYRHEDRWEKGRTLPWMDDFHPTIKIWHKWWRIDLQSRCRIHPLWSHFAWSASLFHRVWFWHSPNCCWRYSFPNVLIGMSWCFCNGDEARVVGVCQSALLPHGHKQFSSLLLCA